MGVVLISWNVSRVGLVLTFGLWWLPGWSWGWWPRLRPLSATGWGEDDGGGPGGAR